MVAGRLGLIIAMIALLWSPPAQAHDRSNGTFTKKSKPTFFITELTAGASFGTGFEEDGSGYALRATFGVGGALRGFPPRFYLIGVARYAALSASVQHGTSYSDINRNLIDVSGGLRVLIPVQRFRFLGEITLGQSIVNSRVNVNDRESYSGTESRFTVYLGVGAQYRMHRNLSLGLMAEWALPTARAARDFVTDVSRLEDSGKMHGWTSLTGAVVVHF